MELLLSAAAGVVGIVLSVTALKVRRHRRAYEIGGGFLMIVGLFGAGIDFMSASL